jgi:acid phosphatase type 7
MMTLAYRDRHRRRRTHFVSATSGRYVQFAVGVLISACAVQCGRSNIGQPGMAGPVGPSVPAAPQIFVGAGDIADCGTIGAELTAKLLDGIGGTVFTLGDNVYPSGSAAEYRDCYEPRWGRHKARTRPVPGNHEYETAGAAAYFAYFGFNAGPPGLGYQSFDLGAWHVVAINSNLAVGTSSPQAQWLRDDLATSTSRCTLAYWHHPLFSSGPNGDSREMQDIWRILYDAGAEIALAGHDHDYERFAPQDPQGHADAVRGIREFVAGTGGAPPYQFAGIRANSEVRLTEQFGVLRLTLLNDAYAWDFISVSGSVVDTGAAACH